MFVLQPRNLNFSIKKAHQHPFIKTIQTIPLPRDKEITRSDMALLWMRRVLGVSDLTLGEAFAQEGYCLLNVINVICPTKYNRFCQMNQTKQVHFHNLQEYKKTVKILGLEKNNFFKIAKFLGGDRAEYEKLVNSILFLKKQYEKEGVIKMKVFPYRTFHVVNKMEYEAQEDSDEDLADLFEDTFGGTAAPEGFINEAFVKKFDYSLHNYTNLFYYAKKKMQNLKKKKRKQLAKNKKKKQNSKKKSKSKYKDKYQNKHKNKHPNKLKSKHKNRSTRKHKSELRHKENHKHKHEHKHKQTQSVCHQSFQDRDLSNNEIQTGSMKRIMVKKGKGGILQNQNNANKKKLKKAKRHTSLPNFGTDSTKEGQTTKVNQTEENDYIDLFGSFSGVSDDEFDESKLSSSVLNISRSNSSNSFQMCRLQRNSINESENDQENEKSERAKIKKKKDQEKKKLKFPTKQTFKKKMKLQEGEYPFELFNLENMGGSIYCRNNLKATFLNLNKSTHNWYIYEMSFGMNLLNGKNPKSLLKKSGVSDKNVCIHKTYKSALKSYQIAKDYLKLGRVRITLKLSHTKHLNYEHAHLVIDQSGFKVFNNCYDQIAFHKWKTLYSYGINKLNLNLASIEIFQSSVFYKVQFESSLEKWITLFTLILFNMNAMKKNNKIIGKNENKALHDPNQFRILSFPQLIYPNKKFLEKLSDFSQIDQKNTSNSINQYWENGGVNFEICLLIKKQYPVQPSFLKLRKNKLKIFTEDLTKLSINWNQGIKVYKYSLNRKLFRLVWIKNNKQYNREPSIIILTKSGSDRSLIYRSIYYFAKQYKLSNK
ncbi:protein unc-13 [Anaeramoeba flamelloides]|uniref:Protein unc-13 n=1 Tax=Anaeramoeba flamelloides TaxID=1746091 RepID=A0AAV7Z197_9EUKA|nr:protein unc-13 [Anaeramoeba flamelloides]